MYEILNLNFFVMNIFGEYFLKKFSYDEFIFTNNKSIVV